MQGRAPRPRSSQSAPAAGLRTITRRAVHSRRRPAGHRPPVLARVVPIAAPAAGAPTGEINLRQPAPRPLAVRYRGTRDAAAAAWAAASGGAAPPGGVRRTANCLRYIYHRVYNREPAPDLQEASRWQRRPRGAGTAPAPLAARNRSGAVRAQVQPPSAARLVQPSQRRLNNFTAHAEAFSTATRAPESDQGSSLKL